MFSSLGATLAATAGLGFLLGIAALWIWAAVGSASGSSKRGSPATRPTSPEESSEVTSMEVLRRLQNLEADQVALSSSLEKHSTTLKRLTSRAGMREMRERESTEAPPPVGASKHELLRHYGLLGKVGPEFARTQQELELKQLHEKGRSN